MEQLTSSLYLDNQVDVERSTEVMEHLSVESESPEHTTEILSGMLKEESIYEHIQRNACHRLDRCLLAQKEASIQQLSGPA